MCKLRGEDHVIGGKQCDPRNKQSKSAEAQFKLSCKKQLITGK